jgi:hypothetical protein
MYILYELAVARFTNGERKFPRMISNCKLALNTRSLSSVHSSVPVRKFAFPFYRKVVQSYFFIIFFIVFFLDYWIIFIPTFQLPIPIPITLKTALPLNQGWHKKIVDLNQDFLDFLDFLVLTRYLCVRSFAVSSEEKIQKIIDFFFNKSWFFGFFGFY